QASLENFNVVNIQISVKDEAIVKELISAVDELLTSRKVLLVFCCDLNESCQNEGQFKKLNRLIEADSTAKLLNLLNKQSNCITGSSAFKAGMLLVKRWGAAVHFRD